MRQALGHHAPMHQIPDTFLLAHLFRHTPGEVFRHLSEKDIRVLRHAVRTATMEMPHYRYRALLAAWRAHAETPGKGADPQPQDPA